MAKVDDWRIWTTMGPATYLAGGFTMREFCVLCGKPTQYDRDTPVHLRKNYVEGAGQLCDVCGPDGQHPDARPEPLSAPKNE